MLLAKRTAAPCNFLGLDVRDKVLASLVFVTVLISCAISFAWEICTVDVTGTISFHTVTVAVSQAVRLSTWAPSVAI
jgi:hypothetical protein